MNVIDLFCGAVGGWSCGLERAGYRTVAACELDPWRRAVFAANHPGCIMYSDVRELTAERLGNDLGYLPDIVVGSPPCQEISAANCKGEGITDDHLFWDWARLVFEIRPLWCAAENSPRSRTHGIDGILDALAWADYARWPCVVGADNAGANHRRKRLWLIAADTLRHELWQQPGWGRGAHWRDQAVIGEHDPNAHGRVARGTGRHTDGRLGLGAGADGDNPPHAEGDGRLGFGGVFRQYQNEPAEICSHIDADPDRAHGREPTLPHGATSDHRSYSAGIIANANGTRHALGPRIGCDDGPELPPALRDIGLAWPHWNGGLAGLAAACAAAGFGAVDDGPDSGMAPNMRNRAIAALGDAVVSKIPEAIGRAMMSNTI